MSNFGGSNSNLNDSFLDQFNAFILDDYEHLNAKELYQPETNSEVMINYLNDGLDSATSIVNILMQKVFKIQYNQYIDSLMVDYVPQSSLFYTERNFNHWNLRYDSSTDHHQNDGMDQDLQPMTSQRENWERLEINVEKKEIIPEIHTNSSFDTQQSFMDQQKKKYHGLGDSRMDFHSVSESMRSIHGVGSSSVHNLKIQESTQRSIESGQQQNEQKSPLRSKHQETVYKQIDMSVPPEIDVEIEQMRVSKDYDSQIRQQKLEREKQRSEQLKEEQQQLKSSMATSDQNGKLFTYDFQGQIMVINPVQNEKLIPTSFTMQHAVSKPEIMKPDYMLDNQNNNQNNGAKNSQKQQKQEQKQIVSIAPAPPVFQNFPLNSGVTLIHGNNVKTGPRLSGIFDGGNNSSILSSLNLSTSKNLRLSQEQYNILIRNGNHSRSDANAQKLRSERNENEDFGPSKSDPNKILDSMENEGLQLDSVLKTNGPAQLNGTITVNNSNFLVTLQHELTEMNSMIINNRYSEASINVGTGNSYLDYHKQNSLQSQHNSSTTSLQNVEHIQNPNDDYNISLLKSSNWGNNTGKDSIPQLPKLPSIKIINPEIKKALVLNSQNPRSRNLQNLNQFQQPLHLPPPSIGKTLGHGMNTGINLFDEDNIDFIFDQYQGGSLSAQNIIKQ